MCRKASTDRLGNGPCRDRVQYGALRSVQGVAARTRFGRQILRTAALRLYSSRQDRFGRRCSCRRSGIRTRAAGLIRAAFPRGKRPHSRHGCLQLRIRSAPQADSAKPEQNVIAEIPDGHPVIAIEQAPRGFRRVQTSLNGGTFDGFARERFLTDAPEGIEIAEAVPAPQLPTEGLVAVYAPRREGTITRRSAPATAHSLNERNQPGKTGSDAQALRDDLAAIVEWLAVDDPEHLRYQPGGGKTYCNIYAHDFCHLAGIYLPRVWWTGAAIERIGAGQRVEPKLNVTIDEQRANDLFRWLRDFGIRFGWRRAGSTTELQTEANQGAIGIIVARRREDGKSGHIVVVVPETNEHRARRDATGNVLNPLQSQAGARNFQYGGLPAGWWNGSQFAESAFWLHS